VYVGNLPFDISVEEVESVFADNGAGPVVRVHLPTGPDGRARGFGFVTLGSGDAANQAISALRNLEIKGRRLTVNLAHIRGDRPSGDTRPPRELREPRESREPREPSSFAPNDAPMMPPGDFGEARAAEGRRIRTRPADWDAERGGDSAKKKKKATRRNKGGSGSEKASTVGRRARGGAGSWKKWGEWDDD
jgi:RNA recognition motif-containing protein